MLRINKDKVNQLASVAHSVKSYSRNRSNDNKLYPLAEESKENLLRFFLFMVAIDHRAGKSFRGQIDKKYFFGTKLRWYLGLKRYREDSSFFSPKSIHKLQLGDIQEWLSIRDREKTVTVKDPEIRLFLLRDTANKLLKLYNGSVSCLIGATNSYLFTPAPLENPGGLIDRLKIFRAYEDPVEKKSFLFVKYLIKTGLFSPKDLKKVHLPIDNHLCKIAIRIGLTTAMDEHVASLFLWQKPCTKDEDILIRLVTRHAYKLVMERAKANPVCIDDILWNVGRDICTSTQPQCKKCPFRDICDAHANAAPVLLKEHMFLDTWYY